MTDNYAHHMFRQLFLGTVTPILCIKFYGSISLTNLDCTYPESLRSRSTVDQVEKFLSDLLICLKVAEHRASHGACTSLLDTSHHHAHMSAHHDSVTVCGKDVRYELTSIPRRRQLPMARQHP